MNFDRVADIYDRTRAFIPGTDERILQRIVAVTGASLQTRFLELGIGTGRIALPFVRHGYDYTGVDISQRMVEQLRAKLSAEPPNLTLVQADITQLPFGDHSFDVVVLVHVLHLVPGWRTVIEEVRRVLKPDGYLVLGYDSRLPADPARDIRRQWAEMVQTMGEFSRPEYGTSGAVRAALAEDGWRIALYVVDRAERPFRPIDLLQAQRTRTFSQSWAVPDDVLQTVHERLLALVRQQYGDPSQEQISHWEFLLYIARPPAA